MKNVEFAVNYLSDGVLELSNPKDALIKFPGRSPDNEILKKLMQTNFNILLHGIAPSSGSLLDPNLCEHFEEFSLYIAKTNQKWLSFHYDYRESFKNTNYLETLEKNINIIKEKFPDKEILMENMPAGDVIMPWSCDPSRFNNILKKYNFKMLLDIPHAMISAKYFGLSFKEYINNFDLDSVIEIHFSGAKLKGQMDDTHSVAHKKEYKCLKYALKHCKNIKMITLEFAPDVVIKADENLKYYKIQLKMLNKMKKMYYKINKKIAK